VAGLGSQTPPSERNVYNHLEELGGQLEARMKDAAKSAEVPVMFNRCGSMFCGYFTSGPVWNVADAMKSDRDRFKKFFHGMLAEGIYLAPSQFEAGFISTAHTTADIEKTVKQRQRCCADCNLLLCWASDRATDRVIMARRN
jgi:glutamate-1-semialdehyde 2,1-aminomutase